MPPLNPFTRACLAIAVSQAVATPLSAAFIEVDDAGDSDPAEGCTLRQAVVSANTDNADGSACATGTVGSDTITFSDGVAVNGSVNLSQSLRLSITDDLTINQLGTSPMMINGMGNASVFYINNANVNLYELTITGGNGPLGAGLFANSSSSVSLTNSTVTGNIATGFAGGILSNLSSTVELNNTVVSANTAPNNNGGGVAAYTNSSVTINNSSVFGNSAVSGAGLRAINGSTIEVFNSTISGNSSINGPGGGAYISNNSMLKLTNSTVSGNSTPFTGGGLIVSGGVNTGSVIKLINSTVSNNSANSQAGGIAVFGFSSFSLVNSIIAGNRAPLSAEVLDILNSTTITADANNLFGDNANNNFQAFTGFTPGSRDISATSDGSRPTAIGSILGELANNGGTTQTHALVGGSPAIDAALQCNLETDQIATPRSACKCDIGAFEVLEPNPDNQSCAGGSFFVIPTNDDGSVIIEL